MYKKTHNSMQGRADRLTVAQMQSGGSDLTDEQRFEMLKAKVQQIEVEIHKHPKHSEERRRLGRQKMLIATELNALKKSKPRFPGISQIFMEEAKRLLPRAEYDRIQQSAEHIHSIRNKPKANQQMAIEAGIIIERLKT